MKALRIGQPAKVEGMSDRSGRIDTISTAPGESIVRIKDHWYLATHVYA